MRLIRSALTLLVLFIGPFLFAQERELYWESLSVVAHLDAEGRLSVVETQKMVFTGDWNGGERIFDLRPRQDLSFAGMGRLGAGGVEIPMDEGSLDEVDRWSWSGDRVLRWRARKPSDPVFTETPMTYVLRYSLTGILQQDGDGLLLNHDFAFPDRDGAIRQFRLELTLDPAWQPASGFKKVWTAEDIRPGKSFVVRVPLTYTGSALPVVYGGLSNEMRWLLRAMVLLPLLLLTYALLREWMLGRFKQIPVERVTREWIEENVLKERAEVIGAMWDGDIGSPEVSAVLARLVAEGKLESNVQGSEMRLTLLKREALEAYELELIDSIFFDGSQHTSTSEIRTHYAKSGFNPVVKISTGVRTIMESRVPRRAGIRVTRIVAPLFFVAAVVALVLTAVRHPPYWLGAVVIGIASLIVAGLVMLVPSSWRGHKSSGLSSALLSVIPAALLSGATIYVLWRSATRGSPEMPIELQCALGLLALWISTASVQALRSTETTEGIAFLKMMGAAREYFRRELEKEDPSLEDAWFPYILAFGLNKQVEDWSRSFPGAGGNRSRRSGFGSSSSGGSTGSSWTGGGGAFGGAGATGTWAVAASGMAAGVAAPRSSGSSSSSGGGSSGGGGGGGW
jgi:uncharacterized membrane protein YgcG